MKDGWRDLILMLLLVTIAIGIVLSHQAKQQIKHGLFVADSIKEASDQRYATTLRESLSRSDSAAFWRDSAQKAGAKTAKVDTVIKTVRVALVNATHADSFKTYQHLADDLYPKQIFYLNVQLAATQHQVSVMTEDRDKWMKEATDAQKDLEALRRNTHVVAEAASRRVNLGILTLPTDVLIGAASAAIGYTVGSITH